MTWDTMLTVWHSPAGVTQVPLWVPALVLVACAILSTIGRKE